MKTNNLLLTIFFFCTAWTTQCDDPASLVEGENELASKTKEKEDFLLKRNGIVYGINRVNLQWLDPAEVEEIATNIDSLDIPVTRIGGVKQRGSISQVIRDINTFYGKEVRLLLEQPMWRDMFPEGYELVPGPSWPYYEMSAIDTARFRTFMGSLLSAIASQTDPKAVVGLELFNEANWAGFNSDLQPLESGKGEVFDLNTPLDHPTFVDGYKGIGKYGQCLKITRELIDTYLSGRNVRLITNGMVLDGAVNDYQFARNHGITIVTADMFLTLLQGRHPDQADTTNYLAYADAVGVHSYPILTDDMTGLLNTHYFNPLNAVNVSNKPYWITEWGFARGKFTDIGGETARLSYINSYIDAIETIPDIEVTTFYEFDLSTNHNIWENGELLESGTFFENVNE